jgi:hypothetical protein
MFATEGVSFSPAHRRLRRKTGKEQAAKKFGAGRGYPCYLTRVDWALTDKSVIYSDSQTYDIYVHVWLHVQAL